MTLPWEEVVSIRDGNELLGAATVTSASGTDYSESQAPAPVPVGLWIGIAVTHPGNIQVLEQRLAFQLRHLGEVGHFEKISTGLDRHCSTKKQ